MNIYIIKSLIILIFICLINKTHQRSISITIHPNGNGNGNEKVETTLVSAHIIMRHGARAPGYVYPNDPNKDKRAEQYPYGAGQITDLGIEWLKNIGNFIRNRYLNFYPKHWNGVFLRSSSLNRTLVSMDTVRSILWPDSVDRITRPIIFSLPQAIDGTLYWDPYCPLGNEEKYSNVFNSPAVGEFNATFQEFYNFVAKNAGVEPTMNAVRDVFDVLRSDKFHGYEIPQWVSDDIYQQMGDVFTALINIWYSTKLSQRLRGGPFLKELIRRIDDVLNDNPNKKIFSLYLAHDDTIAAILSSIGTPPEKYPPFAAGLFFEIHRINDTHRMRVYYMNETETLPIGMTKLNVPICGNSLQSKDCDFDVNQFKNYVRELIPRNWAEECQINQEMIYTIAEYNLGKVDE